MKRFTSIFLTGIILTAFSVSCDQGLYPRHGKSVRIATYNVGVFHKWDGSGIPMTASLMKELAPDVIALQEMDSCANRTANVYQAEAFAKEMGPEWGHAYAPALKPFQGGAYGVAQVWDGDVKNAARTFNVTLPKGKGSETRALCVVEYEDMVVASTHLDHRNDSSQLAQAVIVTDTLKALYGASAKPVFLCGDFNAYPESQTITYCREHWDVLTDVTKTTFPKWKEINAMQTRPQTIEETPGICIDFIMFLKNGVSYELTATDTCIPFETGDVFASSDHLPLYVDVRLL